MGEMEGGSGTRWGGRNRTAREALDAIPAAIKAGEAFRARVTAAAGDAGCLADLMAEAIAMDRASRSLDAVGRDGRVRVSVEGMQAAYCLDAAREAYLRACGSNFPPPEATDGQEPQA